MNRKIGVALLCLTALTVALPTAADAVTPVGNPKAPKSLPTPAAKGLKHAATAPGQTDVFVNDVKQPKGTTWQAALAKGTKDNPVTVEVITATADPSAAASGFRGALVTRTMTAYSGFNLLWSNFRQTWGYHDGFVYYWPNGLVNCYANGPTYHADCQTTPYQEYGLYFNQGHTYWYANLCGAYVNYLFGGSCLSNTAIRRWYTFNADGSWWRFA